MDDVALGDTSDSGQTEVEVQSISEQLVNSVDESSICCSDRRRITGKRRQVNSLEVEMDGFETVKRKKSMKNTRSSENKKDDNISLGQECFLVYITSKDVLPGQFGMAKLLRSENITHISKITFKSPYKVLIFFESRQNAMSLLNCKKIIDMGCRIQMADDLNVCFGIMKRVDLDFEDKEIIENLRSEYDIVSVKRLKRLDSSTGEWKNSESIRVAFKSNRLPEYVYGYDCRFKVEPYIFPVTQCSGCWKFGHLSRSCPYKKIVCPKCGSNHANCETISYFCINCKGPHMALFKECPIFLKEKEIRKIMSEENCNYRKAVQLYDCKILKISSSVSFLENNNHRHPLQDALIKDAHKIKGQTKTYKEALETQPVIYKQQTKPQTEKRIDSIFENNQKSSTYKRRKKNKMYQLNNYNSTSEESLINTKNRQNNKKVKDRDVNTDSDKQETENNCFKEVVKKCQEVLFTDKTMAEKIESIFKIIVHTFVSYFLSNVSSSSIITKLFNG